MYIKLENIIVHQSKIIIKKLLMSIWTNTFIDFLKFRKVFRTVSIFTLNRVFQTEANRLLGASFKLLKLTLIFLSYR